MTFNVMAFFVYFCMHKRPEYLQRGDSVAIVAPSGRIKQGGLDYAVNLLAQWGLDITIGDHALDGHYYFSGKDEDRLSDLQRAINSSEYKAIFCARGGYGLTKIIDDVDFSPFFSSPKWLIGFSDVTALHLALSSLGFQSIHSVMPTAFQEADQSSIESLRKLLFGEPINIDIPENTHNQLGRSEAPIIGGNLSLLSASIGTKHELQTEGKILFIEEIDEYLYKIDRMMGQLSRSGKLKNIRGLVVGQMSQMKDTKMPFGMDVYQLILDHVSKHDYPVIFDVPIGHESYNQPIIQEAEYHLEVNEAGASLILSK